MYVFLNNKFLPAEKATVSAFDHGFLYGDGVYETLRTVQGKVFGAEHHYQRLGNSAQILKITIPFSADEVLHATERLLQMNGFTDDQPARIRWTLTRGENDFDFSGSKQPTFLINISELPPYPRKYSEQGVAVTTIPITRILPQAKTTSLLPLILGRQKLENKYFECLFLENGFITEGTVSNFFILDQKNNSIFTAPHEKVLPGTAAQIFRKKLKQHGITIKEKLFTEPEILEADAAFLTNSLFGLLPVTKLENKKIGSGRVHALFHLIWKDFWEI